MINLFKLFFFDPTSLKNLLKQESLGLRFSSMAMLTTSILISYVLFAKLGYGNFSKHPSLVFILILNSIGSLIVSIISFKLSREIRFRDWDKKLDQMKKTYYLSSFILFGIPYLALSCWILIDKDIVSFIEMISILIGAIVLLYFDWEKYNKLKKMFIAY